MNKKNDCRFLDMLCHTEIKLNQNSMLQNVFKVE